MQSAPWQAGGRGQSAPTPPAETWHHPASARGEGAPEPGQEDALGREAGGVALERGVGWIMHRGAVHHQHEGAAAQGGRDLGRRGGEEGGCTPMMRQAISGPTHKIRGSQLHGPSLP